MATLAAHYGQNVIPELIAQPSGLRGSPGQALPVTEPSGPRLEGLDSDANTLLAPVGEAKRTEGGNVLDVPPIRGPAYTFRLQSTAQVTIRPQLTVLDCPVITIPDN